MTALDDVAFDPLPPGEAGEPRKGWWGNHLAELRWQAELARLLVDPVFRGDDVPRGDGSAVLLIPGFLAGDSSLSVMRGWLARLGYAPHASGIRVNVDCSDRALDRLDERLEGLAQESGRPVSLIGHSRGAHFAKALAHRRPGHVAAVISLGAGLDRPFDISIPTRAGLAAVRAVHARTSDRIKKNGCLTASCGCPFTRDYAGAFPASVPLTSIYSRGDGVVNWPACVVPYADNVEVNGSHVGLAFNRKAYRAVGAALHARRTG